MEKKRCKWVNENDPIYVKYHDEEWGIKSNDDRYLFELLVLESFQAGLSWSTILNKRKNFKNAFDNFDVKKVSLYGEEKKEVLMNEAGIIRNKLKINAAINNAKIFIKIQYEFGSFYNYIWSWTKEKTIKSDGMRIPVSTDLSDSISDDLSKRGMKFVGTKIIYSYLGAIGIVNDHEIECYKFVK